MKTVVMAVESTTQSSVKALSRRFGDANSQVSSLPFSKTERGLARFDGGSELDALREEKDRGMVLTEEQEAVLERGDPQELELRISLAAALADAAAAEDT